jgi:hypothetical protein
MDLLVSGQDLGEAENQSKDEYFVHQSELEIRLIFASDVKVSAD